MHTNETPPRGEDQDTVHERDEPSRCRRVGHRLSLAGTWTQHHAQRAYGWVRVQPRERWLEIAAAVAMLAGALGLLIWAVSSVIDWLNPDPAPAPPPPQPPPQQPPPHWVTAINHVGLWRGIGHLLQSYAEQNAAAAGMPPWLLLTTWIVLGGFLLLGSWFASKRWGLATLAFCAWLAATCWVIWTHTPGGSPVPAVLLAALAMTASVVPWSSLPIAAFVVLGLIPMT